MLNLFEELAAFDRPWSTITFKVRGKDFTAQCRRPNAAEQDALEAFEVDEYARLIVEKQSGDPSELQKMRQVYAKQPTDVLVRQLVGTRELDVQQRTYQLGGVDVGQTRLEMLALPESERLDYIKALNERLEEFETQAREAISAEIAAENSHEDIVEQLAQVNINMKALRESRRAREAHEVYYSLYNPEALLAEASSVPADAQTANFEATRVFPSISAVTEALTHETISGLAAKIGQANASGDLPFDSPPAPAPSGPPSSPTASAEDTTDGGEPIETTLEDSKPVTTPV